MGRTAAAAAAVAGLRGAESAAADSAADSAAAAAECAAAELVVAVRRWDAARMPCCSREARSGPTHCAGAR
eukprot:4581499-Pleurochrysis_carterae.AAC.1